MLAGSTILADNWFQPRLFHGCCPHPVDGRSKWYTASPHRAAGGSVDTMSFSGLPRIEGMKTTMLLIAALLPLAWFAGQYVLEFLFGNSISQRNR